MYGLELSSRADDTAPADVFESLLRSQGDAVHPDPKAEDLHVRAFIIPTSG